MSEFFKYGEEGLGVEMTVYRPGVKFAANSCIAIDPVRESGNGGIIHGVTARLWRNSDMRSEVDWGGSGTVVRDTPAGERMASAILNHLYGRQYVQNETGHASRGIADFFERLVRQRNRDTLTHYRDSVPVGEPSWAELQFECDKQVQSFRIQIERMGFQLNMNRRGR